MSNLIRNFFFTFILLFSISLFFYIYYKSEIFWEGLNREYYLNYYILSLLLIFISLISFFVNKKINEYLFIILISLIISVYLTEGYLLLKKTSKISLRETNNKKAKLYKTETGKKYDFRSILEVYQDKIKSKTEVVTIVHPNSNSFQNKFGIFPLSGISNTETIFCNENGYYAIYKSDRYGFNNPDNEWDSKRVEYLLVGDSFTHGSCVNRPNDIASVLRKMSKKSVLNLGYVSNGPLMEYAVLREYLNLKVNKVLWIYYENDLSDLQFEISNPFLKNYFKDLDFKQKLQDKQKEIDEIAFSTLNNQINIENINKNKHPTKKLLNFIKLSKTRKNIFPTSQNNNFKKILKLTKDLTSKDEIKLYFIYLPEFNHEKKKFTNKNYKTIKNIVNYLDIPFIDIYEEVFKNEKDPLIYFPFRLGGHYNEMGYKKIAEIIYKYTKD